MSPLHGAHTSFPLLRVALPEFAKYRVGAVRDFLMIVSEATGRANGCQETHQMVWFADISVEGKPMVSNFSVPEASGDYCDRGVRFGAHSSNESMAGVSTRSSPSSSISPAACARSTCAIPISPGRSAISSRR
jgi:hypothetical protein